MLNGLFIFRHFLRLFDGKTALARDLVSHFLRKVAVLRLFALRSWLS